ncbi:MAG: hypothetical protein QNJ13_03325 [Paracoccaceae bacterium]|nr:hypothetical protein [Paracoccaceae bacterium]
MKLRRSAVGLVLLALIAALPVQGWAQGAMARITDVVVLCNGTGPDLALIDWRGERVDPLPRCPDCTLGVGGGVPAEAFVPAAPVGGAATLGGARLGRLPQSHVPGLRWPRAPPV